MDPQKKKVKFTETEYDGGCQELGCRKNGEAKRKLSGLCIMRRFTLYLYSRKLWVPSNKSKFMYIKINHATLYSGLKNHLRMCKILKCPVSLLSFGHSVV